MRSKLRRFSLALALVAPFGGCQPSSDELVNQGRAALGRRNFEVANTKFDEALKGNPDDYDALWGKANVLAQQGNYAAQAEHIRAMLKKPALAEKHGAELKTELETSLKRQADQAPSDEAKEALYRQAVELNEKSTASTMLAKHYIAKGDAATKRDDPAAAETAYKAVEALRVSKKTKRDARTKAELAGFIVYKREAAAKLEPVQGELTQAGQFDAAGDKFVVEGVADAPGDTKAEDFEAKAEGAALAAARTALEDLTVKVSGKPRPEGASLVYEEALLTVEEKGWAKKGKTYRVKVSLPRDAVLFKLYELEHGLTNRPAEAGDDEEEPKAAAPASAPASAAAEAPKAP